jgi:glyoxylate reductase
VKAPLEKELGAERVELDRLVAESDVLSLHIPMTPEARHLIGAAQFQAMKRTAVLVNTARGPIVDEAALVEALRSGEIAAAGLDVYENEPRMAPGLAELPNAVLLPHVGSGTTSTRSKMAAMAAENVVAVLAGREPPNAIV